MSVESDYIDKVTELTRDIIFSQDKERLRAICQGLLADNRKVAMNYLDLQQKFLDLAKVAEQQTALLKKLKPSS